MLNWMLFLATGVLAVYAGDRAWLRHVERTARQLHDPEGYLELTARMAELCHGDRAHVDSLVEEQKRRHPQVTHADAVRRAMRQLLEPRVNDAGNASP